jgi:hypothetical protein
METVSVLMLRDPLLTFVCRIIWMTRSTSGYATTIISVAVRTKRLNSVETNPFAEICLQPYPPTFLTSSVFKMKSIAVVLSLLLATSTAFSPPFATRAVGKPVAKKAAAPAAKAAPVAKKVVAKPAPVAKKVVAKAAPKPVAKVAPKPVAKIAPKPLVKKGPAKPAFKLPSLTGKIPSKPKIKLSAPSTSRVKKLVNYVYDDGLTELERRQRGTPTATFLTGSAKSSVDKSAIRPDLVVGDEYFFSPFDTSLIFVFSFVLFSLIIKAGSP